MSEEKKLEGSFTTSVEPHKAARPMKVIVDGEGCNWLCDANVDESKDLESQGCWRCSEVAFTRHD